MEKLDPKAVWIFFFRFLGMGLVIAISVAWIGGIALFPLALFPLMKGWSFLWLIFLFFVIWIGFSYFWAKLSYNAYKFELAEEAFKKEHGVIWKRYVSIPYERIQNIDIHRGIIARILGLSDLMIQTAGYSGISYSRYGSIGRDPEGRLPALSKERAEEIREELIRRAKGTKSGL